MSNSSLATLWVPADPSNYYDSRKGSTIQEITIHHMAGHLTAKRCGELFQNPNRNASSHYGIGYDGTIAQYVDEKYGAWTNSSREANCRAVTIETANDSTGGNWPVNDVTLKSLINLVADIAKRNNLVPLVKGKNLTWHQMYSATACPGPYLLSKIDYIVDEANKIINNGQNYQSTPVTITYQVYDTKWLHNITDHNPNDLQGYAGNFGKPISGIYVDASVGNVYYRAHQKGGEWLPEVKNREDYAGNLGKPIDAFIVRSDVTQLHYQAHDAKHGWLDVISGYDINDSSAGYAGWIGYEIDAIMIWADPIVTITEAPKAIYRIRLTWEDAKSQVGGYTNPDSAIKVCPEGYAVYDPDGNEIYRNNPIVEEKPIYRIRLTWEDNKSQVGGYTNLESAISVCPEGYAVYDPNGNEVYRREVSGGTTETPKQEEPVEIPTQDPVVEPEVVIPEIKEPAVDANPSEGTEPEKPSVEGNPSEEQPKEESQPTPVEPTTPATATSFWKEILEIIINFFKSLFTK